MTASDHHYEDEKRLDNPVDVDVLNVEIMSGNQSTPGGKLVRVVVFVVMVSGTRPEKKTCGSLRVVNA